MPNLTQTHPLLTHTPDGMYYFAHDPEEKALVQCFMSNGIGEYLAMAAAIFLDMLDDLKEGDGDIASLRLHYRDFLQVPQGLPSSACSEKLARYATNRKDRFKLSVFHQWMDSVRGRFESVGNRPGDEIAAHHMRFATTPSAPPGPQGKGRLTPRKPRHCHDCGRPTANYRCDSCLMRWRVKHQVPLTSDEQPVMEEQSLPHVPKRHLAKDDWY
ncbi:MAG: hypothetical protein LBR22_06840 [Desulfovibrio sp.]|nr:hypothetical protein [Desulfovibrio sp.]